MAREGRKPLDEILYDGTSGDPTVVAFDPGGVTGWSVFTVHPDALTDPEFRILENISHWSCGQYIGSEADQVDQMVELARTWPGAAVLCEDFLLRKFSAGRELLAPVRMNAAFSYTMRRGLIEDPKKGKQRLVTIEYQLPALAMTTMTDSRLKALGFYERTVGKEHARDAVRHSITFLKRLKENSRLRARIFPSL